MIMGPLGALCVRLFDRYLDRRVSSGFKMLVDNLSAGTTGGGLAIVNMLGIGPAVENHSRNQAPGKSSSSRRPRSHHRTTHSQSPPDAQAARNPPPLGMTRVLIADTIEAGLAEIDHNPETLDAKPTRELLERIRESLLNLV